jgi:hypothetical protein
MNPAGRPAVRAIARLACAVLALHGVAGNSRSPAAPLLLTAFGAVGDSRTDDTAALQKALSSAQGRCLDGQGREYRVRATLEVTGNLCLTNTRFRQDAPKYDTRPLIRGNCAVVRDPEALIDCGDPVVAGAAVGGVIPSGLATYLFTRTLMVRPKPGQPAITVTLRKVKIDRGSDPASGSRSDAAGLWIASARRVDLEDVEITGAGKGFGLLIADSQNVTARRLLLHDLVWAPYDGDAELTLPRIRQQGWNTAPIREFRFAAQQGARASGFHGVRVQEQLSCIMIVRSHKVVLDGLRVKGCLARFAEGTFPWQTDGVGIGESSSQIRIFGRSSIMDTWEGIDVVGGGSGVSDVIIADTRIDNSFSYGVKLGYALRNIFVSDNRITGAGLAGVVIYGPVIGAVVRRTEVTAVGAVRLGDAVLAPWQQERAGVLVEPGGNGRKTNASPQAVTLDQVRVRGSGHCRFGLLNLTAAPLHQSDIVVSGCDKSRQDPANPSTRK